MRYVFWFGVLVSMSPVGPAVAQERINSAGRQYVPSGFGVRGITATEVELALDAAGGRDKVYLYGPPNPTNWNHLWTIKPAGDAVMLVSKVDGMALDAGGGAGNPYPRVADPNNINHLWILANVGDNYMIWSKVKNVVLDANGGRGRPYLSDNPDPRNINQLWSLRPVAGPGGQPGWQIGQSVPAFPALGADGSPLRLEDVRGKTVLLNFWSPKDVGAERRLDLLRDLRREFAGDRFRIVSVCVDCDWDDWLSFLNRQKPLDEKAPGQPVSSDSRWWQYFYRPATEGQPVFSGRMTRDSFLIGPDGKLLAVGVRDERLRAAVAAALTPGGPK
ncbi:MAG TPA: redoxin domain-containing protein [Gemmataceae bacterium]|nr:redoxin domain-containing protein [Gemmataceae bacterium]